MTRDQVVAYLRQAEVSEVQIRGALWELADGARTARVEDFVITLRDNGAYQVE
jgi:hypothetical protein